MGRVARSLGALILAAAVTAPPVDAASRCAGSKLKAVGQDATCLIALDGKEAATGATPDPTKLERCRDRLEIAFLRAEAQPPCPTTGDASAVQTQIDACVADLDAALSVGIPSKCQSVWPTSATTATSTSSAPTGRAPRSRCGRT